MLVDWVPYSPSDYEWFLITKRDKRVSKIHVHEQHSIEDPRVTCRPRVYFVPSLVSANKRLSAVHFTTANLRNCIAPLQSCRHPLNTSIRF